MSDHQYPVIDEITGEIVSDPDGGPIHELTAEDYLGLADRMSIEERAAGERAWRFGHVIVDEAQDLTPMQWRMVARRARGHSMTIVGDVAQRSRGAVASWDDLLPPELGDVARYELTTNYRSPREVGELATRVLAAHVPGLAPSVPIRSSGEPVRFVSDDPAEVVRAELDETDGRIAVIAMDALRGLPDDRRLTIVRPQDAKGMEFDSVIVVEPATIVEQSEGLGDLYVAITRSTERLTIVHSLPLPEVLAE